MKNELDNDPSGALTNRQALVACQALVYIVVAFVMATAAFLFVVFQIASNIQRRSQPLPPPSNLLMGLFYFFALFSLVCSTLWMRFRVGVPALPYKDFQKQTMVSLALANVSEYLGIILVLLGGAFALSVPLLAGTAVVTLMFILPVVLKRLSALKQRSGDLA